jgi:hypothetical protein
MSTQKNTAAQSADIKAVTKSIRFWVAVFAVFAIVSIISAVVATQSVISNGVMVVAAAIVVLKVMKREKLVEDASLVRVTN